MPASEAQKRAKQKYEAKAYEKILVRIRADGDLTREQISRAAEAEGETVNAYILGAVRERMDRGEKERTREREEI